MASWIIAAMPVPPPPTSRTCSGRNTRWADPTCVSPVQTSTPRGSGSLPITRSAIPQRNGWAVSGAKIRSHWLKYRVVGKRPNPQAMMAPVLALTSNIGNDLGFEHIFVQQLIHSGRTGDLVVAISGSGNSPNVLAAVEWASRHGRDQP